MTFREYQKWATENAVYPDKGKNFIYPALGLAGEAGEVIEKIKKIWRDKNLEVSAEDRKEIGKEIGDVLWYLSQLSQELELDFEDIARLNIEKVSSRVARQAINGAGDNR